MKCSDICQTLILVVLVHWFIGINVFIGFFWNMFTGVFGFAGTLISYLLAYIFILFANLIPILYGIWNVIALIINIAYLIIIFLIFNYRQININKTLEHFFMMAILILVIPYIFNWLFFHQTLRIYLLLPVNLALFFAFLDFRSQSERINKTIVNFVLFTVLISVIA